MVDTIVSLPQVQTLHLARIIPVAGDSDNKKVTTAGSSLVCSKHMPQRHFLHQAAENLMHSNMTHAKTSPISSWMQRTKPRYSR